MKPPTLAPLYVLGRTPDSGPGKATGVIVANSIPAVRLGDSDALQAGSLVLASGAPFGLLQTKLNPNGPAPPLHMPGFKDMLSDAQINDLVAYLISLKPKGEDLGF